MKVYALGMYWDRCQVGDLVEDWSPISLWKRRPFRELCHMVFRETHPLEERHVTTVNVKHESTNFLLAMCHNPRAPQDRCRLAALVSGDYPRSALSVLLLRGFIKVREAIPIPFKDPKNISLRHFPAPSLKPPLETLWSLLKSPPSSALTISKLETNLEETKSVMFDVIDKVLERGVKIDTLVQRSQDLSESSKLFYRRTRALSNRCCLIS